MIGVEDNLRLLIGEIKPHGGFGLQRKSSATIILDEQMNSRSLRNVKVT
jgi:hypothetical protein